MKCPHCSFDNRDDAAFCENCGEVFVAAGAAKVSVPSVVEVPPVVHVPDIAPASSKSAVRASVADLVDPVLDGPEVPDLSGFERLVDSSYVPPAAAQAGDTAEIPRINEEYVPRARSYAMGPTEKELRRRDRQQKKLAKKFTKMQEKEEARKAKELLRAEKERLRAETAAEKERLRAAEAEAREQRRIAEEEAREARRAAEAAERERLAAAEREEHERAEQERVAAATAAAAVAVETAEMGETPEFTTPGEDAPVAESEASKAGDASGVAFGAIPGAVAGFAAVDATAKDDDLDEVLSSGDEVVSLFERSGKRPARMGSHAARPSVNRQKRNRGRGVPEEASAAPENPEEPEMPASSPDEPADVRATEETALMEAASAIVGADQATVTTAEAEEALAPRATGELAVPAAIGEVIPETEPPVDYQVLEEDASAPYEVDDETSSPAPTARPPRAKGPIIAAACIVLAVVLAAVAGGTYMAELWSGKTIPEVVGLSQPEAVDALAAKGFAAQAVEVKSDDPQGTVLSSDPEQGHRAEEGSTVTLSVAVPRIVPAIVGATSDEATQALEAEGFTAVTYTEEKSNEAAGTVLAVSPEAGTEAKSGDAITVTVAVPYTVPDVEGMSEADAKAALEAEGYEVSTEWYTTEDIEEGTAVSTDPTAGSELNSGSEVTLYVAHSRGTELVDLTREILPGANLTNDEGSFKVENIKSCTYRGDGEVLYTVEARQYEVVTMPFGLGQETVFAKKLTTIEGGIVWNDDNEVSYASPSIRY
ncbi:PASTA domain-containing protein [Adlercreutzia rubneri]